MTCDLHNMIYVPSWYSLMNKIVCMDAAAGLVPIWRHDICDHGADGDRSWQTHIKDKNNGAS